jgi:hypothetical protein
MATAPGTPTSRSWPALSSAEAASATPTGATIGGFPPVVALAGAVYRYAAMERTTLDWFDLLARALIWAAGVVLVLSLIGAIAIASSNDALPLAEDLQRQGRGIAAVAAFGGGLAAAGVLSGLGAILRLMLIDRIEREERELRAPGDEPVA